MPSRVGMRRRMPLPTAAPSRLPSRGTLAAAASTGPGRPLPELRRRWPSRMLRWISAITSCSSCSTTMPLDHVLELADVARPVVLQEQLTQLVREPRWTGRLYFRE